MASAQVSNSTNQVTYSLPEAYIYIPFLSAVAENCSVCKTKFSVQLAIFQGVYRTAICIWRLKLHTYTISLKKTMQAAGNIHNKS